MEYKITKDRYGEEVVSIFSYNNEKRGRIDVYIWLSVYYKDLKVVGIMDKEGYVKAAYRFSDGLYEQLGHDHDQLTEDELKEFNDQMRIGDRWKNILSAWNHYNSNGEQVDINIPIPIFHPIIWNEEVLKNMRVIDNHKYYISDKLLEPYRYKERLAFEQNQQDVIWNDSDKTGRLLTLFWEPDLYQNPPHFHVVDYDTMGEKINAAYCLLDGTFFKHGSVMEPLCEEYLKKVQEKIDEDWNSFMEQSEGSFYYKYETVPKVPILSNRLYKGEVEADIDCRKRVEGKHIFNIDWYYCINGDEFMIGIFQHENDIQHPHFHVIDKETKGEKINFAFRFDNGKLLLQKDKHYIMKGLTLTENKEIRQIPTYEEVQKIQKMIIKGEFKHLKESWVDCYSRKNLRKKTRIPKLKIN